MKRNYRYLTILLLIAILSLSGYLIFRAVNKPEEQREILYYQSGMHPWIKSDKPGKCPICGMDLVPVYEPLDSASTSSASLGAREKTVHLTKNQLKHLNVQTAAVAYQLISKEIRTVGTVAYDPGLLVAEEEFVAAVESGILVETGRRKLRLMGLSEKQIDQLAATRKIDTNLILAEQKMWVYAAVYEQDLGWIKAGQNVRIKSVSYPEKTFIGIITAIEPVLEAKTGSAKVRIKVSNPQLLLKPQMYVDVYITSSPGKALAVPKEAVLDTGKRKVAYVEKEPGLYEAREVVTGAPASGFIPIIKGLHAGEKVVTSANFLIDSQSQLTGGSSALYGGATEVHQHDR